MTVYEWRKQWKLIDFVIPVFFKPVFERIVNHATLQSLEYFTSSGRTA